MGEDGKAPYGITVLVKNQSGMKELYRIISSIHFDGVCDLANLEVIKQNRKNLLIGSCGNAGELCETVADDKDYERVAAFYDYFELYPTDDETERKVYKILRFGGCAWYTGGGRQQLQIFAPQAL